MATDYPTYFSRMKAEYPDTFQDPETSTLEAYLTGNLSTQQCAAELSKYTNRRLPANSKLGAVYNPILFTGRDMSDSHGELIALLKELRTIPSSRDTGGIEWTSETQAFDELTRAVYDGVWSDTLSANQASVNAAPEPSETSRQWINLNAFLAQLYANQLFNDLFNALKLIVDTLEKKNKTPTQLEMNLGAAAAWLEYASKEIRVDAGKIPDGFDWAEGSEIVEGRRVDGGRLATWRERLESLSATKGLSGEVGEICERASLEIEKSLWEKKK